MLQRRFANLVSDSRVRSVGLPVLGLALLVLAWQATTRSVDFPVYYREGADILAGNYGIYPSAGPDGTFPPHGFRYAPAIAFLMAPIALVPLPVAALALFVLKLGALAYMARVVATRCGRSGNAARLGVSAFLLCAGYAAEEMRYGNVQLLCVAALVAAFDGAMRRRIAAPALALALSIATKLTPLILVPLLAVRRAWVVCLVSLVLLVGLAEAPAAILGQDANLRLLQHFADYAREKVDEQDNYAWRGVVDRAVLAGRQAPVAPVTPAVPAAATALWLAGSAALGAAAWRALRHPTTDARALLLELSLVLTLMPLISPHTQRRYFVALFVPSVTPLAVADTASRLQARTRAWMRAGQLGILLPGTVLPALFAGHVLTQLYQSLSIYFFGAVVLFASLVVTTLDVKQAASMPKDQQAG